MSRQSQWVAGLISQLTIILMTQGPALAQTAFETNRVVYCLEDPVTHALTLTTARHVPLPPPQVSYLPGDEGETIMVVDFSGLSWNLPTRIIRLEPTEAHGRGIQEVRLGRFQESPPVCRISIIARDPRAFKQVSFTGTNAGLTVKWSRSQAPNPGFVRVASNPNPGLGLRYTSPQSLEPNKKQPQGQDDNQIWSSADLANPPKITTPRTRLQNTVKSDQPDWQPQRKSASNGLLVPLAPPIKRAAAIGQSSNQLQPAQQTQAGAALEKTEPPPLSVTADCENWTDNTSQSALMLTVKAAHPLAYSTFRLHDPERYVVDFSNCPELTSANLPDIAASTLLKGIRVGQPEDQDKTRLVLDLSDEQVNIKEESGAACDCVRLSLSRLDKDQGAELAKLSSPQGTVVVLDAGHGGSDPGAQRGDVQEKEITMAIVAKLKRILEEHGTKVVLTRADDTFVSLEDRVRITNSLNPTLFLSVHINAMESANDIHGIETYYQTDQSKLLADAIHERLVAGLEAPDRAIRKARFYVIKNTPVPAVLAEVGFISNKEERDKLISSDYQAKVAEALEQGVMLYLDKRIAAKGPGKISNLNEPAPARNSGSSLGTNKATDKSNNVRIATGQNQNHTEDETR